MIWASESDPVLPAVFHMQCEVHRNVVNPIIDIIFLIFSLFVINSLRSVIKTGYITNTQMNPETLQTAFKKKRLYGLQELKCYFRVCIVKLLTEDSEFIIKWDKSVWK